MTYHRGAFVQTLLQWKSNNITYCEGVCVRVCVCVCMCVCRLCVYVALDIQHAMHMCYTVMSCVRKVKIHHV